MPSITARSKRSRRWYSSKDLCPNYPIILQFYLSAIHFRLTSLRTLDLSKNKIQHLGQISRLSELKSLNCDENMLTSSALSSVSKLTKLQTLSLGKNRLENPANQTFPSLPSTIKQLKIHGNSFSTIPRQICDPKLKSLEKLDLSSNNLAAVPTEISNLGA